jgi:hypothetical protein
MTVCRRQKTKPKKQTSQRIKQPKAKKSNVSLDQTKARSQETKEVKPFNKWKK